MSQYWVDSVAKMNCEERLIIFYQKELERLKQGQKRARPTDEVNQEEESESSSDDLQPRKYRCTATSLTHSSLQVRKGKDRIKWSRRTFFVRSN